MPFFNAKTEEEKEAERIAKELQQAAQERELAAQAEREARAKYLTTPTGQAETAYEAGQMFFQLTTNISQIQGKSSDWSYSQSSRTKRFNATDILRQIEEIGWHLEHVGYVFVETGEVARSKVLTSGSVTRTDGYVEGIYLFRRRT